MRCRIKSTRKNNHNFSSKKKVLRKKAFNFAKNQAKKHPLTTAGIVLATVPVLPLVSLSIASSVVSYKLMFEEPQESEIAVDVSDSCDFSCPACGKKIDLKGIDLFHFDICTNPSCRNVSSRNLPFCEVCWRPFKKGNTYENLSLVIEINTVEEIHDLLDIKKSLPQGTYVVLKGKVSQNISKSFNQLMKGYSKEISYAGDIASMIISGVVDPTNLTAIPSLVAEGIALSSYEKEAYKAVPLSMETQMIYERGFRIKYNDGDSFIIRKEF